MKISGKCPILALEQGGEKIYQSITAQEAGWEALNMEARTLDKGETLSADSGDCEMVIVLLGGNFTIETQQGKWSTVNGRKDVFSGLPHAVYLPINTQYTLTADQDSDISICWVPADETYPIQYITPADVVKMGIEFRGGDNASRQINRILPPGSQCQKIVCVEVYTPSGNWSSFPAHKHDERKLNSNGELVEADLEEIYFYKIDKPQGFALQMVYNDDKSLDEIAKAHNNDVVLVPEGYHPVVSAPGYNTYYLNYLAGSDQALSASDDPDHKWYYGQWESMDQRLPIVTEDMNK